MIIVSWCLRKIFTILSRSKWFDRWTPVIKIQCWWKDQGELLFELHLHFSLLSICPIREVRGQCVAPEKLRVRRWVWDSLPSKHWYPNPESVPLVSWKSPHASGNSQALAPWDPTRDTGQCAAFGWQYESSPRKHQKEKASEGVFSRARLNITC